MRTCLRSSVVLLVVGALVGCGRSKESTPAGGDAGTVPKGLAGAAERAAEELKAPPATEPLKEAAAKAVEEANEAANKAKAEVEGLAGVADAAYGIEKLQALVGSLSREQLTGVADQLATGLKDNEGVVKSLQERLSAVAVELPDDVKKQLETARSSLEGLQKKLALVVGRLKEMGVDVSKYTALLGGS